jgi:hypothetical protein
VQPVPREAPFRLHTPVSATAKAASADATESQQIKKASPNSERFDVKFRGLATEHDATNDPKYNQMELADACSALVSHIHDQQTFVGRRPSR